MSEPEARLLDAPSAGRYLGVSVWTLRHFVAHRRLHPVKLLACRSPGDNRRLLFDRIDLDKFVDECRRQA
jgi:hypothetical protein